jgi:menaquinone-dependent protoporphyrinogen oxidase
MKVLAVYGSAYGQAAAVLRRIARALETHGHEVTVVKGDALPRGLDVEDFDAFVIAASIIMGRYQPYITRFARRYASLLNTRPSAFVSVNGHSPESAPEWQAAARQYVRRFLVSTTWKPQWTATFSGALRYTRYGLVTRLIMRMISRQTGGPTDTDRDYEFTDWNAVETFGEDLAGKWSPAPAQLSR